MRTFARPVESIEPPHTLNFNLTDAVPTFTMKQEPIPRRRYFYPPINLFQFHNHTPCPVSLR